MEAQQGDEPAQPFSFLHDSVPNQVRIEDTFSRSRDLVRLLPEPSVSL